MLVSSPVGVRVWAVLLCVVLCAVLLCRGAGGCGYIVLIHLREKKGFHVIYRRYYRGAE